MSEELVNLMVANAPNFVGFIFSGIISVIMVWRTMGVNERLTALCMGQCDDEPDGDP